MKVILASGSPRRRELLEQIGMRFEVITSNAEEHTEKTEPEDMVKELSRLKADAVFQMLLRQKEEGGACLQYESKDTIGGDFAVIGADTIVYYEGRVYGKPKDEQMAYDMLQSLSNQVHQVYTGVTILTSAGQEYSFYEKTDVRICSMSEDEIWQYIKTGDPMDKAGAYGIQGAFAAFVEGIHGDYNNVVGLPVSRLYHELKNMKGSL